MERERAENQPAVVHLELPVTVAGGGFFLQLQAEVGACRFAVGVDAAVDSVEHTAQQRVVEAGGGSAVEGYAVHEFDERAFDVGHVAVAVHVLAVEVGDDGEDGRELEEAAVGFVGFGDEVLGGAEAGVGAEGVNPSADDHGGVEVAFAAARSEHGGDHAGGGGLAMHSGYGDSVFQTHQFGQHFRALDDGNLARPGFQDFGICGGDCRTGDYYIARRGVGGRVALVDDRAQAGEALCHRRPPQVRA